MDTSHLALYLAILSTVISVLALLAAFAIGGALDQRLDRIASQNEQALNLCRITNDKVKQLDEYVTALETAITEETDETTAASH